MLAPTVLIPLVTVLQLAGERLGLVCKLKVAAAVGHEMTAVFAFPSATLKMGWLGGVVMLVINTLKPAAP